MDDTRKPGTFQPGDKRINRRGRPKSFDALRALAQQIAHEPVGLGGMTVAEAILKRWAASNDARLQIQFMEVAFGKVPAPVELSGKDGGAIQHEDVGLTDEQRISEISAIFDKVRARQGGQAVGGEDGALEAIAGATD